MQAYPGELRGPAKGRPGDEAVVVFEDVRLAFDDNVVLDGISFKSSRASPRSSWGPAARASPPC